MTPRGWTLVEVLIVTVVVTVIGGLGLVLSASGEQLWVLTDARMAAMTTGQSAVNRLSEALRTARRATLDCAVPGALAFTQTDGTAVAFRCEGCTDASPGVLVQEVDAQPQVVAAGLADASFTCSPEGVVSLAVTAQVTTMRGVATQTLTAQVWVKNP